MSQTCKLNSDGDSFEPSLMPVLTFLYVHWAPIAVDERGRHNLHIGLPDRCDISTMCRMCHLENTKHTNSTRVQNTTSYSDSTTHIK